MEASPFFLEPQRRTGLGPMRPQDTRGLRAGGGEETPLIRRKQRGTPFLQSTCYNKGVIRDREGSYGRINGQLSKQTQPSLTRLHLTTEPQATRHVLTAGQGSGAQSFPPGTRNQPGAPLTTRLTLCRRTRGAHAHCGRWCSFARWWAGSGWIRTSGSQQPPAPH